MGDRNDLTRGPIVRKLIVFFLPIAAGMLFQQLYNAVDAFVVGRYVGTVALAAVGGSPYMVSQLVIGFCTALANGAAVVISQFFGAKENERVTRAVQTAYLFCAALGLVAGAIVMALSPQILILLRTPQDTFADALRYQQIYFSGTVFMLLFNMGSGILRAVGDSVFPFFCLAISCGLNIGLDILFVVCFSMGVAGVGYATVIAQAACAAMVTGKLMTVSGSHRLTLRSRLFSWNLLKKMLHIGVPSGLQASMYGISNALLQVGINTLGTIAVASWAMTSKIDGSYWAISSAFGAAVTTMIGQNFGAGNISRVREAAKKGSYLFLAITVGMSSIILSLARFLIGLFTDDPAVSAMTWHLLLFFVPVYFLWSYIEVYTGVLRGAGDAVVPSIILAVGVCGFRVLWIFTAFILLPTIECIAVCYPITWFITSAAIFYYYRKKSVIARYRSEDRQ